MKLITDIKEKLQYYINNNEVVYQFCGELVEVSNETMQKNKNTLLDSVNRANYIEMYGKHDSFVKDGLSELTEWSSDDDVLFLLDGIGVLTLYWRCISGACPHNHSFVSYEHLCDCICKGNHMILNKREKC